MSWSAITNPWFIALQDWRKHAIFDNIYKLSGVPVITVQLRYNGWVTEMQDPVKVCVWLHAYRAMQRGVL